MVQFFDWWLYFSADHASKLTLDAIYRRPGYILLSEAVDLLGRSWFSEWSGTELTARAVPTVPTEKELRHNARLFPPIELVPPPPVPFQAPQWRVLTSTGVHSTETEEEARAIWEAEWPFLVAKLVAMWRLESAARSRFESTVLKLRQSLDAGASRSFVHRLSDGNLIAIPAFVWGREVIPAIFDVSDYLSGRDDTKVNWLKFKNPDARSFRGYYVYEGRVLLIKSEVGRLAEGCVLLEEGSSASIVKSRSGPKRGRPSRSGSLADADAPLIEDMETLIANDSLSPTAAARKVVKNAAGYGTEDNKIRRLVQRFNKKNQS